MSVKIYTGFEFLNPDFLSVDSMVRNFRNRVYGMQEEYYGRFVARLAVYLHDAAVVNAVHPVSADNSLKDNAWFSAVNSVSNGNSSALSSAFSIAQDREFDARRGTREDSFMNTDFEIWTFISENRVAGILNSSQRSWASCWMRQPGIRSLSYWNNSDRPSGISEKEWNARGEFWEKALGEEGIPASSCWTAQLHDEYALLKPGVRQYAARAISGLSYGLYTQRTKKAASLILSAVSDDENASRRISAVIAGNNEDAQAVDALNEARFLILPRLNASILREKVNLHLQAQEQRTSSRF